MKEINELYTLYISNNIPYIIIGISIVLFVIILVLRQRKVEEQPAEESYFFSESFSDLVKICKETWRKNKNSIRFRNFFTKIIVVIVGGIITVATTITHSIVFSILFLVIYMFFSIIWVFDSIYNRINKISTACPRPECQFKFSIPIYVCSCGAEHTQLRPGKYGILKRRCRCGNKLATSFMNGRGKINAICPKCKYPIKGETLNKQYAIPIIGGPSVGKTCYINAVTEHLSEDISRKHSWDFSFVDSKNQKEYEIVIDNMKKGLNPEKTDLEKLTAYQFMIKSAKSSISRRLYLYDIMGEVFSKTDTAKNNRAFSYANGYVFLIDPLSIGEFAVEVVDEVDLSKNGASEEDFTDIFEGLLNGLTESLGVKSGRMVNSNFAVCINKCDLKKLDMMLGEEAVEQCIRSNSDCNNYFEAKNKLCKDFLVRYGCNSFVGLVEKKFKNVQYFTCSSTLIDNNGCVGVDVEKPVLWILEQADDFFKQ